MILKTSEELTTLDKIKKVFNGIVNDIEQGSIEVEESSFTIENNRTVFKISLVDVNISEHSCVWKKLVLFCEEERKRR